VAAWLLALAAGAFWVGILVAGLASTGAAPGWSVALLAGGLAGLVLATWRHARADGSAVAASLGSVVAVWTGTVGSFGLLGAGWAGLREAHVRRSPVALLAATSWTLGGRSSPTPRPGCPDGRRRYERNF
jgi:hypothetical protein